MNNYKVYTGPTLVEHAATLLRDAGLRVTCAGTEHVYVQADNPAVVLAALRARFGTGWSHRDVVALNQPFRAFQS